METHKALITTVNSEQYLSLKINGTQLDLPLTKDEPNEIKEVFNELIRNLKKGLFCFSMEEKEDGDLVYQVANEYVKQLNKELEEVYQALKDCQLLE
jgi:hypothetical protein